MDTFNEMKAVLFDLDGTLADTAPDLGAAANHVRKTCGLSPLPLEQFRPYASYGAQGLLRFALDIPPEHVDFEMYRHRFFDYYEANVCRNTQWFAGVPALIATLESAGVKWGIVTNKHSRFAEPLMVQLQPMLHAGCVVCGDATLKPKPFPDSLFEGAKRLKVAPEKCCYVGDALRDIEAAQAAGMYSIGVTYGYVENEIAPEQWGADHLCGSLSALADFFENLFGYNDSI